LENGSQLFEKPTAFFIAPICHSIPIKSEGPWLFAPLLSSALAERNPASERCLLQAGSEGAGLIKQTHVALVTGWSE